MSGRPVDWSPLGWDHDPVPGDPLVVSGAAATFQGIAEAIDAAKRNLLEISLYGEGEAIDKIRQKCDELAVQIGKAHKVCDGADDALKPYADALEDAQGESVEARRHASEHLKDYNRARASRENVRQQYNSSQDPCERQRLRSEYYVWQGRVDQASGEVESARAKLRKAIENRDQAAEKTAAELRSLMEGCDLKDSFWDKICGIARSIADFCEAILPVLKLVGTILAVVGIIVLIFVPGGQIALIVAIASLAVASATLAAEAAKDLRDVSDGKTSWGEFGKHLLTNALDVGLSAVGMASIAKSAKLAKGATKTAKAGSALDVAWDGIANPAAKTATEAVLDGTKRGFKAVKRFADAGVPGVVLGEAGESLAKKAGKLTAGKVYSALNAAGWTGEKSVYVLRASNELTKTFLKDASKYGISHVTNTYDADKQYFLPHKLWVQTKEVAERFDVK